jgi:hypothetical protein
MQSYYSVYGTPLHLIFEDEFAANYNRAQDAFTEATKRFKEATGYDWKGQDLIIDWTDEEQKAFNEFADLLNLLVKINGGSLDMTVDDMTSNKLEKL